MYYSEESGLFSIFYIDMQKFIRRSVSRHHGMHDNHTSSHQSPLSDSEAVSMPALHLNYQDGKIGFSRLTTHEP